MALQPKQKAFVEHFLVCWNATEAARRAGYSEKTARSIGAENLTKPDIAAEIKARVEEMAMSANEVLLGIADHARGSMADFYRIDGAGNPVFDLKMAAEKGKLHLIKKLETKTSTYTITGRSRQVPPAVRAILALPALPKGEGDDIDEAEERPDGDVRNDILLTEVTVKLELYDRMHARELLGKHHKLFGDKLDVHHTGLGFSADDAAEAEKEINAWKEQRSKGDDTSSG